MRLPRLSNEAKISDGPRFWPRYRQNLRFAVAALAKLLSIISTKP
jgi:hypothetical protein